LTLQNTLISAATAISNRGPRHIQIRRFARRCDRICKLAVACGRTGWRLSIRSVLSELVGEPVAGCLPGHAERDGDPVPAASFGACGGYPFSNKGFIAADLLGCLGDRPQV